MRRQGIAGLKTAWRLGRKGTGMRSDGRTAKLTSGRRRPSPGAAGSWDRVAFTNGIRSPASLPPVPLTQVPGAENVLSEADQKRHPGRSVAATIWMKAHDSRGRTGQHRTRPGSGPGARVPRCRWEHRARDPSRRNSKSRCVEHSTSSPNPLQRVPVRRRHSPPRTRKPCRRIPRSRFRVPSTVTTQAHRHALSLINRTTFLAGSAPGDADARWKVTKS